MGKPYQKELDHLPETYAWAMELSIDRVVNFLRGIANQAIVTIGSGGSFTSADFVASLHRQLARRLAFPLTPMEAATTAVDFRSAAAVLLSAGGKNPDVLGTLHRLVQREPRRFLVFCTSTRTPLFRHAAKFKFVDSVEIQVPTGRDGFLATNSLLATAVLFLRAYSEAFNTALQLPGGFQKLLGSTTDGESIAQMEDQLQDLWKRETVVVLHGPATRSAAIDFESKFTESALGNVQVADYRNFAHGRHHWLAKRASSTGVIAFLSPEDGMTGSATVKLLPKNTLTVQIETPFHGPVASLATLIQVLFLVGSAGRARGIDPGRPGVPTFGRKIYHLKAEEYTRIQEPLSQQAEVAIARKVGASQLACGEHFARWQEALAEFTKRLGSARFRGLILDYDGTLCDQDSRFAGLKPEMSRELTRILRAGALVGIATGRGQSARIDFQKLLPKEYWRQVIVGYYNGGDIGDLAANEHPDGQKQAGDALMPIAAALQSDKLLSELVEFEFRRPQIQVRPKDQGQSDAVWRILQQIVHKVALPGVSVLRSSHSMDVLAPGVSKQAVVDWLVRILGDNSPILCIGDLGQWPGNDFSLLAGPYSLSVDEVSLDLLSCWNLALPGHRGTQATLDYLKSLRPVRKGLRLVLPHFQGRRK